MTMAIAIRRRPNGALQARRNDGKPLTAEDREEAWRLAALGNTETPTPAVDSIIDERTIAVLIDSSVLGTRIWFALRDGWTPEQTDDVPIFYASELPALREQTAEQLRSIFNVKRTLGGSIVRK